MTRETKETRITTSLQDCECKKTVTSQTCQCSCPQPKTRTFCNPETGSLRLIQETSRLDADNCSCSTSSRLVEKKVECPKEIIFDRVVTACQPDESGEQARKITWTNLSREGCKCVKKLNHRLEKCGE